MKKIIIVFVLTENLKFFYRLNAELNRLKVRFKILSFGARIPDFPSIILTTEEESGKIEIPNKDKVTILPYANNSDFDQYITKFIAAYRIGYKSSYSELIFSIDPGTKYIGLVVFLDDYYLTSHTFYENSIFVKNLRKLLESFQNTKLNPIKLNFKFGKGVISTDFELVRAVFEAFKDCDGMRVFLIDETKSSQVKLLYKGKKLPIHEASALILALREGIEVNRDNFQKSFKRNLVKKKKKKDFTKKDYDTKRKPISFLGELAEKLLNGDLSLSESLEMMLEYKELEEY